MYFAVQESDFLLCQNTDFGITDLFISNLEKVNSADEVGLGELATYDQLRTLTQTLIPAMVYLDQTIGLTMYILI